MSAKQDRGPSLGHAELRLVLLLEDLERTIETAERLANAGLEDEAIRVIDLQRDALAAIPDQVAGDVAPPPRRRLRRLALAGVAAVVTVLGSIAGAVGLIGEDGPTVADLSRLVADANEIKDPAEQLDVLDDAIVAIAALPAAEPARAQLVARVHRQARRVYDENDKRRRPEPGIGRRALEVARAARALAPAPASSGSPLDGLLRERGPERR